MTKIHLIAALEPGRVLDCLCGGGLGQEETVVSQCMARMVAYWLDQECLILNEEKRR